MKYLMTIMLIALSINTFAKDDNYVICEFKRASDVAICVNQYIDKGYKPLSGLHAVTKNELPRFFQALIKD
tara:strand:+ start:503 stop:715 length:213 start_codon:yes stop_codon:yes gene_type:complete